MRSVRQPEHFLESHLFSAATGNTIPSHFLQEQRSKLTAQLRRLRSRQKGCAKMRCVSRANVKTTLVGVDSGLPPEG